MNSSAPPEIKASNGLNMGADDLFAVLCILPAQWPSIRPQTGRSWVPTGSYQAL